jgi:hypothetical protein
MKVGDIQTELAKLAWGLQAADAPAFFFVWQDDVDSISAVQESCGVAGKPPEVIGRNGLPSLERLEKRASAPDAHQTFVLQGYLSSLGPPDRKQVNAERGWLLSLDRQLIFVEPVAQERSLRQDCPDLFSVCRDSFHLNRPVYQCDYQWDSTAVGRWDTLVKTLPAIVTRGSIIVERGKPHFKGPPLVECPRCKVGLARGTATLTFRHAPAATREQQVEAWVCSCGEFYVPGEIAREAYLRAFQRSSAKPAGEAGKTADSADVELQELRQTLLRWAGKAKGLPADLARNHDHYLHGRPKK